MSCLSPCESLDMVSGGPVAGFVGGVGGICWNVDDVASDCECCRDLFLDKASSEIIVLFAEFWGELS